MQKIIRLLSILAALLILFGGCAFLEPGSQGHSPSGETTGAPPQTSESPSAPPKTEPTETTAPEAPTEVPTEAPTQAPSPQESIPFEGDQLYAVAYLGYQQIEDWDYYASFLDRDAPPVHYVSPGDYYLVIPRYPGMGLSLYVNDLETGDRSLRYEDTQCVPFLLQCNVSDVFSDVTIRFVYQGEAVEFSPFLSLENGAPVVGERGLDLTKP